MQDPTFVKSEIDANPIWKRAFLLSEELNDNAPIGWSEYIDLATCEIRDENVEQCDHSGWTFEKQGRCCFKCGGFMVDFGD